MRSLYLNDVSLYACVYTAAALFPLTNRNLFDLMSFGFGRLLLLSICYNVTNWQATRLRPFDPVLLMHSPVNDSVSFSPVLAVSSRGLAPSSLQHVSLVADRYKSCPNGFHAAD